MDLAKIRQKARKGHHSAPPEDTPGINPPRDMTVVAPRLEVVVPLQAASIGDDFFTNTEMSVFVPPVQPCQVHHRKAPSDPIEIIQAGRMVAGCNEYLQLPSAEQARSVVEDYEEFLCIRVSNEIYGINIMSIKEIIKSREVTEIPRAPSFVSGIISLRGVIIPIVDMLDRLGLMKETVTSRGRIVVVRHGDGFTGLLVDEVIQVVRIAKDRFEPAPAVLDGINRDFVSNIGRTDNRMIILLNLDTITDINLY
jgi:purine-binding chemotaxis protein CheW